MTTHALMAVPVHLVARVGDLIAQDAAPSASANVGPADDGLVNGWSETDIRDHYRSSSENMQKFLVFLAAHADEEVDSDAAATEIGFQDWNGVAGMLGAAHRRASNHYGYEEPPWLQRWVIEEGRYRFKMPTIVARIVLDEAAK